MAFRGDQFRMMGVLTPWLTANLPAIGRSKAAAQEAADVVQGFPAVQAKAGLTATETKQVTERRGKQRKAFETRILSMLGPMQMVATAAKDMDFLALVTIGRSAFRHLRPELQAGVRQQVLAKADANTPALDDHAIGAPFLAEAHTLADAFQQGLPDTQSLLDARKNANATHEEVHEAEMTQIYELNKAMSVFETVDPALFKGYKAARAGPAGFGRQQIEAAEGGAAEVGAGLRLARVCDALPTGFASQTRVVNEPFWRRSPGEPQARSQWAARRRRAPAGSLR